MTQRTRRRLFRLDILCWTSYYICIMFNILLFFLCVQIKLFHCHYYGYNDSRYITHACSASISLLYTVHYTGYTCTYSMYCMYCLLITLSITLPLSYLPPPPSLSFSHTLSLSMLLHFFHIRS